MSTTLITLALILGYLVAGWRAAHYLLPRMWAASRRFYRSDDGARSDVKARFILTTIFWPVFLLFGCLSSQLGRAVDSRDPVRIERERRELQDEITRLERELGMR